MGPIVTASETLRASMLLCQPGQNQRTQDLLRPRCPAHLHENGADIRAVPQLLGHARLETTSIDTQVAIGHLREVYQRTHPAAVIEIENGPPEC